MNDKLTGYTPEDEQLVAAHVAAFIEQHFEAMTMQESMGSLRIMRTLQTIWQTSKENPDASVNPVLLETIETALQRWSLQQADFKPLFDKNPQGALLLCVATFFRFYEELLDGVAAVIQAQGDIQSPFKHLIETIPDDIHITDMPPRPRMRPNTGRKARNQRRDMKQ